MSLYSVSGIELSSIYDVEGASLTVAYDINGNLISLTPPEPLADYTNYSYTQKWGSKSIGSTQGFDIYGDKVFWVSKSGDSSIPANCYVWNLSDGSQALDSQYITIYSGHGNNLSFDFPTLYASPAYSPCRVYVNNLSNEYVATLTMTLSINDGSKDCDACVDETNKNILWTLGHTGASSDASAPYYLSKWDLSRLTASGDNQYAPRKIQTVIVAQPQNSYYFQGCKFHDGVFWFANGYSGTATNAYVFGVNPNTGEYLYTIDCNTTSEPEGVAWYPDANAVGGYALYVGFQGMMLRKYTFGALT